jgi:hypothetical protein
MSRIAGLQKSRRPAAITASPDRSQALSAAFRLTSFGLSLTKPPTTRTSIDRVPHDRKTV